MFFAPSMIFPAALSGEGEFVLPEASDEEPEESLVNGLASSLPALFLLMRARHNFTCGFGAGCISPPTARLGRPRRLKQPTEAERHNTIQPFLPTYTPRNGKIAKRNSRQAYVPSRSVKR